MYKTGMQNDGCTKATQENCLRILREKKAG